METYLDNSATTRVYPEVRELMDRIMEEDFGNPASLHTKGVEAENYVRKSKDVLAKILRVEPKNILFTSGGTESNNMALIGAARANRRTGKHLITTKVEHPSIKNVMKYLEEEEGYEITYLPVDQDGVVSVSDLQNALREDTILVSIMYVNNEIGALMPIRKIGEMLHKERPDVLFHVDAIQAFGKYKIYPKEEHIDLLSVSSHKIHGPKGVGFLYIREGVKIHPILFGGGQQKNMRSGTENVPGEAGLGLAAEMMYKKLDENVAAMRERKQELLEGLQSLEEVKVNGKTGMDSAPHIVSASFKGVRSEVLLHALEERNIYVSSGSACASSHPSEINTLLAIGLSKEEQEGTIRFSFCEETSKEQIEYTIQALKELLPFLRRFKRR